MELLRKIYESYFIRDVKDCPYFNKGMDSFAILLKGKSLELLPGYDKEFTDCFLVNNFDEEIRKVGPSLENKNCVHVVNRLMTAPLTEENYKRLNITEIQMPKVSCIGDKRLTTAASHYKSLGLNLHYLPKHLLEFNKRDFDEEYATKYPNTGILAIIYALEMLKPKTLWIIGLDFYQSDYLVRRSHQNPLHLQQQKMDRTNMVGVTANIIRQYPEVNVKMVSYYQGFPEVENIQFMHQQ